MKSRNEGGNGRRKMREVEMKKVGNRGSED